MTFARFITVTALSLVFVLGGPTSALAINIGSVAGGLLDKAYGGKVILAVPCTCSKGDWLVTLGPPSPGTYLVNPLTVIKNPYLYGLYIVPGVWHLGKVNPIPARCWQVGEPCWFLPATAGTIKYAGTSLPGL